MPPTCSAPRKPGTCIDDNVERLSRLSRLSVSGDTFQSSGTEFSTDNMMSVGMPDQLIDGTQMMQVLAELLLHIQTNLKFTKAIYRGTKKSLVGPGFEPTRLNTNDAIFGASPSLILDSYSSETSDHKDLNQDHPTTQCSSGNPRSFADRSHSNSSSLLGIPHSPRQANRSFVSERSRSNLSSLAVPQPASQVNRTLDKSQSSHTSHAGLLKAVQLTRSLSAIPERTEASSADANSQNDDKSPRHSRQSVGTMKTMTDMISRRHFHRKKLSVRIWRFFEDRHSSRGALYYFRFRNLLLVSSIIVSCFETFEESVSTAQHSSGALVTMYLQLGFEALFAAELIVRFLACRNRTHFLSSIYNLIDLVAVLPIALRLCIIAGYDQSAAIVSLLGTVLVLRALRFARHFETFHLLLEAFTSAAEALPILLYMLFLVVGAFASLVYFCESRTTIPSFPMAVYYSIITVSTVGYGDFTAQTDYGRLWSAVLAILGPMYMAIPIATIGSAFGNIWEDRHRLSILQRMRQCVTNAGYSPVELKHMFEVIDGNGDGTLDLKEFTCWLEVMDLKESEEFIQQVFDSFDADDEGTINFDELLRGLFPRTHRRVTQSVDRASQLPQVTES